MKWEKKKKKKIDERFKGVHNIKYEKGKKKILKDFLRSE